MLEKLGLNGRRVSVLEDKVERAIDLIIDAMIGEAPHDLEVSRSANDRRIARAQARTTLLQLVFLAKRAGREEVAREQRRLEEAGRDGQGPRQ